MPPFYLLFIEISLPENEEIVLEKLKEIRFHIRIT
jgi:hypothetical protein